MNNYSKAKASFAEVNEKGLVTGQESPPADSKTARMVQALTNGKYGKNKAFRKQLSLVVAHKIR